MPRALPEEVDGQMPDYRLAGRPVTGDRGGVAGRVKTYINVACPKCDERIPVPVVSIPWMRTGNYLMVSFESQFVEHSCS